MTRATVPKRVEWAVSVMEIQPTDHVLEIGCGRGEAVTLICAALDGGTITAIDRSAKMIAVASERNASCIAATVATFLTAPLADMAFGDRRFDAMLAINVGSLWRQRPPLDLMTVRDLLAPNGRLYLVHEPPPGSSASPVDPLVAALATVDGLMVIDIQIEEFGRTRCGCVTAMRPAS